MWPTAIDVTRLAYVTPTAPRARNAPKLLLPLPTVADGVAWEVAAERGPDAVPVVGRVDTADDLRAALTTLIVARSRPLARVNLGYGTRPLDEILDEIAWWVELPVCGFFFDLAPSSPYQVGPVARAIRAARRDGLGLFVLNAGTVVDPIYRELPATICTFEGTWAQYRSRPAETFAPGDGHLVLEVPPGDLPLAHALTLARGAGLFVATTESSIFDDARDEDAPGDVLDDAIRNDHDEPVGDEDEREEGAPPPHPRQRMATGSRYRNRPSRWERPGIPSRTTR